MCFKFCSAYITKMFNVYLKIVQRKYYNVYYKKLYVYLYILHRIYKNLINIY